jgi:hypothetical protein
LSQHTGHHPQAANSAQRPADHPNKAGAKTLQHRSILPMRSDRSDVRSARAPALKNLVPICRSACRLHLIEGKLPAV